MRKEKTKDTTHLVSVVKVTVSSLALDDVTLNNLFWSIIIWFIIQTQFSTHIVQTDDLLQ